MKSRIRVRIIMKILLFFGVIFCVGIFSNIFLRIIPGGQADTNLIISNSLFIIGEIAVCTYIIAEKLDKLRNENKDK
jgi:hypothetical protein